MACPQEAVHRTVLVVDVEESARLTDPELQVMRAGLYQAVRTAFDRAGIPWDDSDVGDRGDGVFVLSEAPKGRFVALPRELVTALEAHNRVHSAAERIRLRMALHAGEVRYDPGGAMSAAVIAAFRLLNARELKDALRGSAGVLAVIVSSWFYDDVLRHRDPDARHGYHQIQVSEKEFSSPAWICLPGDPCPAGLVPGLNGLSPALHDLLQAQCAAGEELPYRLLSGPQPKLSEVYVEQRAERQSDPSAERHRDGGAERHGGLGVAGRGGERRGATDREDASASGLPRVCSVPVMLRESRHALMVGEPGAGKSTLLRRLVGESAAWYLSAPVDSDVGTAPCGRALPVWIPASALAGRPLEQALAAGVTAELGAYLDGKILPELFRAPPIAGVDWLILVDGLDEILDARERRAVVAALAGRLTRQRGRGGAYRFVVTSRPLPEQDLAAVRVLGVGDWRLQLFDQQDLEMFARSWFAARHPRDAEQDTRQFLDLVARARLQAIIRIPLLAVITAVVYEQRGQRALPVGRAELYEEFLRYLLQVRQETTQARRELRDHMAPYAASAGELADWLFGHQRPLLEYLAAAFLSGRDKRLADQALTWAAERCPELPRLVPDWATRVADLLRSTGVLLQRDGDLQFLHHSFAEYLAAGPAAGELDPGAWRREVLGLATQNLALFTLARWASGPPGRDPAVLVQPLLDRGDDEDVLAAAAVLAHGIGLPATAEAAIIRALLTRVHGAARSTDFLTALSALPGRPAVTEGLADLMTSPKTSCYTRVAAAGTYATLADPAAAVAALSGIARDPFHRAHERVQAARALGDLGETAAALQVLAGLAADPAVDAGGRVLAASAMANLGETAAALQVLAGLAADLSIGASQRAQAARALGDFGEPAAAIQVLTSFAEDPGTDTLTRIWAARDLAKLRPEMGIGILAGIAADPQTGLYERVVAGEQLARLGEHDLARPILHYSLRSRAGSLAGMVAVRALADAGDREFAIEELKRLARSRRSGGRARVDAAKELSDLGQPADAAQALRRVIRSWYVSGYERTRAARAWADLGKRDRAVTTLTRIMRGWHTAGTRLWAAWYLASLGEPDRAIVVLRRVMRGWHVTSYNRVRAARDLADLGERDPAVAMLRRFALSRQGAMFHHTRQIDAAGALAELGKRDIAVETLRPIAFRLSLSGVRAARQLARLGERESAKQALTSLIRHPRTKPDYRLLAGREVLREWGPALAVSLLTETAQNRRISAKNRVRAATDLAKIEARAAAVATLKSIASDSSNDPIARFGAAAVLLWWKMTRKS